MNKANEIFWGMSEQAIRKRVVEEAAKFLDVREGSREHKAIVDTYNSQEVLPRGYELRCDDAWCAAFISVIGIRLKIQDVILPEVGCGKMIELYRNPNNKGTWQELDRYVPEIADIIMYDWEDDKKGDCTGSPNHVGMVICVRDGVLSVMEGNYSDRVRIRELRVDGSYIRGYCLPDYASLVHGFQDVPADAWYREAIMWTDEQGIAVGIGDDRFGPELSCSRAQAVTMLHRYFGTPVSKAPMLFDDVAPDAYYADAVRWAEAKGITEGIAAGAFAPNAMCTRSQIAAMIWRAAGRPQPDTMLTPFEDVPGGCYYADAVAWAYCKGITIGASGRKFLPNDSCTRAQIAAMLYRLSKAT